MKIRTIVERYLDEIRLRLGLFDGLIQKFPDLEIESLNGTLVSAERITDNNWDWLVVDLNPGWKKTVELTEAIELLADEKRCRCLGFKPNLHNRSCAIIFTPGDQCYYPTEDIALILSKLIISEFQALSAK